MVGWLTNTALEKRGRNTPVWPHISQAYYPGVYVATTIAEFAIFFLICNM